MHVKTNVAWTDVPEGTIGRVVEVYGRNDWALEGTHGVMIEWIFEDKMHNMPPLRDGFSAEHYGKYLTELGKQEVIKDLRTFKVFQNIKSLFTR
jgi:hypothetical protein